MIRFPLDVIPFLNQTIESVVLHTALDKIDSRWLSQLSVFNTFLKQMEAQLAKVFLTWKFDKSTDYIALYSMHQKMIHHLGAGEAFSNPTMFPTYTDFITNQRYLTSDEVFVQRRVAGPCPFLLQLVTRNNEVGLQWSKLKSKLNSHIDFDSALAEALGEDNMTMMKAVSSRRLYVLYHEEKNALHTVPDYFGKQLRNTTTPITIFVRTTSGDLKVAAIQLDDVPTSDVHTPHNSHTVDWLTAKTVVNTVDTSICQGVWHLSHIHFSGGLYCTLFKSHFSSKHPIHQMMRHHCEGTSSHIALSYPAMFAPDNTADKLFSIGNEGYAQLTVHGVQSFKYGMLDFNNILRARGLDSNFLKYHPFRDDGRVIWSTFQRFANQLTNIYYKSDLDVRGDAELQSFANQVSADGKGASYGGKANIAGFPHRFDTKKQLKTFLTRFVWQVAMHAVMNYPLEPFASFPPLSPTKMYDGGSDVKDIHDVLPDSRSAIGSVLFASLVGNMRVNRIFDYHDKLTDWRLRALVLRFHGRMHGCVQRLLEKRNAERKFRNEMGLQYLEPKWLTNSVHI